MTAVIKFHAAPTAAGPHAGPLVPEPFADLAPWMAEWSIGSEKGRAEKRIATPIAVLREFHAATLPRLEAMIVYLNTLPNDPHALVIDHRSEHAARQIDFAGGEGAGTFHDKRS